MRISKDDIPVRIGGPGAKVRQQHNFGQSAKHETFAGEYASFGAGTDLTPLLKGLEDDLCQSPHWGYMISGEMQITYTDGRQETVSAGDLFYLPPGHTALVIQNTEIVMFSPQHEHGVVLEHIEKQLAAAPAS